MTGELAVADTLYLEIKDILSRKYSKKLDYALVCINIGGLYFDMNKLMESECYLLDGLFLIDSVMGSDNIYIMPGAIILQNYIGGTRIGRKCILNQEFRGFLQGKKKFKNLF